MAIVQVIGVALVYHGRVAAVRPVLVIMAVVDMMMDASHLLSPLSGDEMMPAGLTGKQVIDVIVLGTTPGEDSSCMVTCWMPKSWAAMPPSVAAVLSRRPKTRDRQRGRL